MGGGALLDIGIYPIYLSLQLLGIPNTIKAMARMTATEVDSYVAMLFDHENGSKALLEATFEAHTPTEATIFGSKGSLKIHSRFHQSEKISWFSDGSLKDEFETKHQGNGYFHEIEEANTCLLNNEIESKKLPHQMSLDLITVIDKVKEQIGLDYN